MPAFRTTLIGIFFILQACGGGGSDKPNAKPKPQPTTGTRLTPVTISSAQTNFDYPVYIYLPADYESSTRNYPAVYSTDAESRFNVNADVLDELETKVVMIGIGFGDAERRAIDYSLPGARDYYNFLTLELIPFIEAQYRINPNNRTITGHSRGGEFAGTALLIEDPAQRYFKHYVAQDGAFWEDTAEIVALEQQLEMLDPALPVTLYIAGAKEGNAGPSRGFRSLFLQPSYSELTLIYRFYALNHNEIYRPSFKDAMTVLFSPEP